MRYSFDQPTNDPQQYYWFKQALTPEEVKKVIMMASELPIERATTIGTDGVAREGNDPNGIRSSMVKWIPQDENWDWLYHRLLEMAVEANNEIWNFDLISAPENIQYTEYYASENGHYDWHQDIGPGNLPSRRKVSITIQLSDSEEYKGGDLQLCFGGDGQGNLVDSVSCPRGAGVGVLFPSYMLHRVSEVEAGVRKSLVLWVGGSHYR